MSGTVTVRYFAAAKQAAGAAEEQWPAGTTVAGLVADLGQARPELSRVLRRCSYLLDEVSVRDTDRRVLHSGATVDVLPPFAGG